MPKRLKTVNDYLSLRLSIFDEHRKDVLIAQYLVTSASVVVQSGMPLLDFFSTKCLCLLFLDPRLLEEQTTQFGRTALHAAAAADRPKVLQLLLSSGARMYATDAFDQKPVDVATQFSCYLAERLLKYWVLRRRTAWGGDGSDIKSPERRSAERSHVSPRTASAHTRMPRTLGVRHVTLHSDQANDDQSYDSRLNMWAETGMWAPTCNPGEPNGPCKDLLYETVNNARSAKLSGRNTRVSKPTSFRAQSAKYYHGRFHKGDEDDFAREDR